jgi:4-hydroxybenzoate polyprenyltransferase
VFWFALLNVDVDLVKAVLVFITLHLFVYPASNGYNSYFDRDEKSIGGLKHPPKVTKELWYLILIFDGLSLITASMVSFSFAFLILIYMLMSKAYSYDKIRLKKFPVLGAVTVVIFQGWFTYLAVQIGCGTGELFSKENITMGLVSTLFLLGSYPMTQIYQHDEDHSHGDRSLSMMLGIKGTFLFAALVFFLASALLITVFLFEKRTLFAIIYLVAILPSNIYFLKWYSDFQKGKDVINFQRTMKLNAMSSLLLSAAFILMLILK